MDNQELEARIAAAKKRVEFAVSQINDAITAANLALQSLSSLVGSNDEYRIIRDATNTLRIVRGLVEDKAFHNKLQLDRSPLAAEEVRYNLADPAGKRTVKRAHKKKRVTVRK